MKKKPVFTILLVVLCLIALAVGCAGTRKSAEPVFKDEPQATPEAVSKPDMSGITVSPEKSREGPFEHPFTIRQAKLAELLQGIY